MRLGAGQVDRRRPAAEDHRATDPGRLGEPVDAGGRAADRDADLGAGDGDRQVAADLDRSDRERQTGSGEGDRGAVADQLHGAEHREVTARGDPDGAGRGDRGGQRRRAELADEVQGAVRQRQVRGAGADRAGDAGRVDGQRGGVAGAFAGHRERTREAGAADRERQRAGDRGGQRGDGVGAQGDVARGRVVGHDEGAGEADARDPTRVTVEAEPRRTTAPVGSRRTAMVRPVRLRPMSPADRCWPRKSERPVALMSQRPSCRVIVKLPETVPTGVVSEPPVTLRVRSPPLVTPNWAVPARLTPGRRAGSDSAVYPWR